MFEIVIKLDLQFRQFANTLGEFISPLVLRVLLAWEYYESGLEKLNGENWFRHILNDFPFPFNVIDPEISWAMATWFELIGAAALLVGLATRYVTLSLMILTIVATMSVHFPPEGWSSFHDMLLGYSISDKGYGNYKLPLLYMVMFIPLLFSGPGKLSVDYLIQRFVHKDA